MIPDTEPVKNHYGNNVATEFDFDFFIENEAQLKVTHTSIYGIQNILQYGIDYSIHEIGNENGSYIVFPIQGSQFEILAWNQSTNEKEILSLALNLPFTQEAEYEMSKDLNKKNLEKSFDKLTRIAQILRRKIERAVKVPEGSSNTPDKLIESINQAQLTAQSFAQVAGEQAAAATNYATSAGENAASAQQILTELQTLHNTASNDITTKHQDALKDMQELKTDYNNNATLKTNSLKQQFEEYTENLDGQLDAYLKNYDRLYQGVDLEVKFADEISAAGNVYTWLENRKNTENFEGIHIGDYFHTNITEGIVAGYSIHAQNFKCRIVGINTYKSCANTSIGNMLYVISDDVIDTPIKWNPVDNNNGTNNRKSPWIASAIYAILNGINNYDNTSGYNKAVHGANADAKGIFQLLPSALQDVIKQKRMLLDERYSASGLLTGSTNWNFGDGGKLWLPNEVEVHGCGIRSNLCQTTSYWFPEAGLSIQFPWFANNCEHRIKKNSLGEKCSWWLSSVTSLTAGICRVDNYGSASSPASSHSSTYVPLCFCI